jgi:hypothetical protein
VSHPLHWSVIAVDGDGRGHGTCGHEHATAEEAVRCDWAPAGWDDMEVCDLLVRQLRTDATPTRRRTKDVQLGLWVAA